MSSLPAMLLVYENTTQRPSLAQPVHHLSSAPLLTGQGCCYTLFSENRGDKRFSFLDQVEPGQEKTISLKGSSSHDKSKIHHPNPNPSQWVGSGCLSAPPVCGHTHRLSSESGLRLHSCAPSKHVRSLRTVYADFCPGSDTTRGHIWWLSRSAHRVKSETLSLWCVCASRSSLCPSGSKHYNQRQPDCLKHMIHWTIGRKFCTGVIHVLKSTSNLISCSAFP